MIIRYIAGHIGMGTRPVPSTSVTSIDCMGSTSVPCYMVEGVGPVPMNEAPPLDLAAAILIEGATSTACVESLDLAKLPPCIRNAGRGTFWAVEDLKTRALYYVTEGAIHAVESGVEERIAAWQKARAAESEKARKAVEKDAAILRDKRDAALDAFLASREGKYALYTILKENKVHIEIGD